MTAEERGAQMMSVPIGQLPPIAVEFARDLCRQVGKCGEVLLTAWTIYAQCVENLPCTDDLYLARGVDETWFQERMSRD